MASIRKIERLGGRVVYEARWIAEFDPDTGTFKQQRSKTFPSHREAREWLNAQNAKLTRKTARSYVVYFVQGVTTGLIKIGVAKDVDARLRNLQCGSPDKLRLIGYIKSAVQSEAQLHARFAAHRAHGEWFHCHPDILTYIAENAEEVVAPTTAETAIIKPPPTYARWANPEAVRALESIHKKTTRLVFTVEEVAGALGLPDAVIIAMNKAGVLPGIGRGTRMRLPMVATLERMHATTMAEQQKGTTR